MMKALQLLIATSVPSLWWDLDRRARINLNIAVTYHATLVLSRRKNLFNCCSTVVTDSAHQTAVLMSDKL